MKSLNHTCFLRDVLIAVVLSATLPLHAADEVKKIISTTEIDLGTRSIIYQRVEPPKVVETAAAPVTMTAARVAAVARVLPVTLSLSCTVHDSGVTAVSWWHAGAEYRVVSSIDFNELRSLGSFTAEGSSYTLFMSIGNAMSQSTMARLRAGGAKLPASVTAAAPTLPASVLADMANNGGSRYAVLSAPEKLDAAAFEGVAALHRYYDAHKTEIIAATQKSEADRAAQEQWLKENPPGPPPDTVIQFWPSKGSRYLDAGNLSSGKEAK